MLIIVKLIIIKIKLSYFGNNSLKGAYIENQINLSLNVERHISNIGGLMTIDLL